LVTLGSFRAFHFVKVDVVFWIVDVAFLDGDLLMLRSRPASPLVLLASEMSGHTLVIFVLAARKKLKLHLLQGTYY
jgi:hypothetical protein